MDYRINLHSHTIFSDGANTPLAMALEAKRLDHTALVITDHYFGECGSRTLDIPMMKQVKKACKEARQVLPVILGIELNFAGVEMLTFGTALINNIMNHRDKGRELTVDILAKWKRIHGGAFILCHPGDDSNWPQIRPLLDGFEEYNSGQDWFKHRGYGVLDGLPHWCNSDAHQGADMDRAWNIVGSKITDEAGLIKYIKRGSQPKFYIRRRD